MGVFCTRDGTEHPEGAVYCMKCGQPLSAEHAAVSTSKAEYKEVYSDWSKRPPLFSNSSEPSAHPESMERFQAECFRRVTNDIRDFTDAGWVLDGPFDTAVRTNGKNVTSMWKGGNRWRYSGVWVRLRRFGAAASQKQSAGANLVPTAYSVVLLNRGLSPIETIKAVRKITGLGLKDAKDLVDSSPSTVHSGLSHDDAVAMQATLQHAGAGAELRSE